MKTTYMVMFGGGIGECQSTRDCNSPLSAIKQWVRGQNPKGRYTAPMDTWITTPSAWADVEGQTFGDLVIDIPRIRDFYQWILKNDDRLLAELNKQSVYVPWRLLDRATETATKVLAMTDEEIREEFDGENLTPFTGG